MSLHGRTLLMSGGSRGIGLAIALRAAEDGANLALLAKTVTERPRLAGTIYTAARQIEAAGGAVIPIVGDVRNEADIVRAVDDTVAAFGGIDIVVNNASALDLGTIDTLSSSRFDLMHAVNVRGTYLLTAHALPHLRRSTNPHVLIMSPPIDLTAGWLEGHLAYSISKYGMSMCTIGLAERLSHDGVAVNSLWPATLVATAAVRNLLGGDDLVRQSRTPEIVAEAAHRILTSPARDHGTVLHRRGRPPWLRGDRPQTVRRRCIRRARAGHLHRPLPGLLGVVARPHCGEALRELLDREHQLQAVSTARGWFSSEARASS